MRFRLGAFGRFYRRKEYNKAIRDTRTYIERFVQKTIDYRVALNSGREVDQEIKRLTESRYIFSYELSKQTLDKTNIADQLVSIMFAGRDTTAGLLSTVFFILAREPDVWTKLRKEVLALDGKKPSFEDLKSMTYLTWVVNESKHHPSQLWLCGLLNNMQLSACTHSSLSIYAKPTEIHIFPLAVARMESPLFTYLRATRLSTAYTQCSAIKKSSDPMRMSSAQRDGKISSLVGGTFRLTEVLGYA